MPDAREVDRREWAAGAAGAAGAGEDSSRARPPTSSRWAWRASTACWSRAMVRPPGRARDGDGGGLAGSSSALGLVVAAGGRMRSRPGPLMAPWSSGWLARTSIQRRAVSSLQRAPVWGGGQQDQGAVAGVDRLGELVHLRAGEPAHARRGWPGRCGGEGRGPPSTTRGGEGGVVQVAGVDGGVADAANKRQVGRDRAGREAFVGQVALPRGDGVGVQLGEGEIAEAREDPGGEFCSWSRRRGGGGQVSRRATRSWPRTLQQHRGVVG